MADYSIQMVPYGKTEDSIFQSLRKEPKLYNLNDIALKILISKGFHDVDSIYHHLTDNINSLEDTTKMKDALKFCEIVQKAIEEGWDIVCYTDYDMDGIGAGAICVKGIRKLIKLVGSTSTMNWYANNRFVEGYGITPGGVDDLMKQYPTTKLIITTDNGIVGYDGVQHAKDLGLTVVVTDHHTPKKKPTVADAIVDPKQADCESEFKDLCGAGIIFKLILLLAWQMGFEPESFYDLVDICAMSTVGDMVALKGDNRIIVKEGLRLIQKEQRLLFKVLRECYTEKTNRNTPIVNEELLGFTYCPMFNALGRLEGCIDKAMQLLLSEDEEEMRNLTFEIIQNNEDRKVIQADETQQALEMLETLYPTGNIPDVILLKSDTWHEGVVGLIASDLKERYNRPTIVFTKAEKVKMVDGVRVEEMMYKGSARSIDGFDIMDSLNAASSHLLGYGGHKGAAGLSVKPENFDALVKALNDYAKPVLTDEMKKKKILVDSAIKVGEISEDLIESLDMLRPFGMDFEKPNFGLSDFIVDQEANPNFYCGATRETVRLKDKNDFTVIMFKHPEAFKRVEKYALQGYAVKVIGYPSINTFNGKNSLQFQVTSDYMFV